MQHYSAGAHIAATFPGCRRKYPDRPDGCGGRVMWEADPRYPAAYFGLTGTCLSCGWSTCTQDLLAPTEVFALVPPRALPDHAGIYYAMWKRLMGGEDAP